MFNLDSEFLLIPPNPVQFKLASLPSPIPYFHLHVFYRQTLSPQKTSKLFSFSLLQHIKQFKNFIPYHCEKQISNKSSRLVCSTFFLWSNSIQSSLDFVPPRPRVAVLFGRQFSSFMFTLTLFPPILIYLCILLLGSVFRRSLYF